MINFQGNYDAFVRTREEQLENQMKQYNWEQDQIAHMKVNIKLIAISIYIFIVNIYRRKYLYLLYN